MERKLARIEQIAWKKPIEDADNIELVGILGWQCVTGKSNNFQIGDYVIYIEVDSVLPSDNPEFAFLEKSKYRIKTIRLKKQLSQGLVMPLSILGTHEEMNKTLLDRSGDTGSLCGVDVTDLLRITKYEKEVPVQFRGLIKGNFPTHLFPKTDEERIQNIPHVFEKYADIDLYATEKLEGTSASYYYKDGVYGVCSRNMEYKLEEANKDNVYVKVGIKFDIENKLKYMYENFGAELCIQGEIVGPGVESNKMGLTELDFYIYNVYKMTSNKLPVNGYTNRSMQEIYVSLMGLKSVPVCIDRLRLSDYTMESLIESVNSFHWSIGNKALGEGIVIRPLSGVIYDESLKGRLSFKVKNNAYLLKAGE